MSRHAFLGATLTLLMSTVAFPAAAEPSFTSSDEMASHMQDWFDGERSEAYIFLGAGLVSLGGGIYLVTREDDLAKGAGYSTAILGGLMTVFSITYNLSLGPTHDDLKDDLRKDPVKHKQDETKRMEAIADRFVAYRWAEIGALAVGAGLITYGTLEKKRTFTGVGIGLAAEAALLLGLDYFAERRTHDYLDKLNAFSPGTAGAPLSQGFSLGYSGRF